MADFSAIEEKRKRKYPSADLCGKQASGSGSGWFGGEMIRYATGLISYKLFLKIKHSRQCWVILFIHLQVSLE